MSTSRLETFADGVFAIAATLLILNVGNQITSAAPPPPNLRQQLLQAWPSYVAYCISFLTIGIIWAQHHTFMAQIERADRTFLMLSGALPDGRSPSSRSRHSWWRRTSFTPAPKAAAVAYGITLTLTAVMFNVVWLYASVGRRLLNADADPRTVSGITRTYLPGPFIYLVGTLIVLVNVDVGVVLFLLFALFYVLESSLFGRRGADVRS